MSFGDLLSELAGSRTGSEGAAAYTRGVVITQGVRAGESANSILSGLSSLGIGLNRQLGLRTVAAEHNRQQAGATANQLDLSSPISELLGAEPPEGFTGQYVHQLAITYRSRDEEGHYMLNSITRALKSSTIMSPLEASSAVLDIMAQAPPVTEDTPEITAGDIVSVNLSGAWYDVQNRSIPGVAGGGGTE